MPNLFSWSYYAFSSPCLIPFGPRGGFRFCRSQNHSKLWTVVIFTCFVLVSVGFLSTSIPASYAASNLLVVPSEYSTIQSAINAANSGDTVKVLPGTYTEQLFINKSISLIGSGAASTTINAPKKIIPDSFGVFWGVHVANRAMVTISGFTFSQSLQPYSGCISGSFPCATIDVDGGATLHLASDVVGYSFLSNGLFVGFDNFSSEPLSIGHAFVTGVDFELPPSATKDATFDGVYVADGSNAQVSNSRIVSQSNYAASSGGPSGGFTLAPNSTASILHNTIIGGLAGYVSSDAHADISYNTIEPTSLSPFTANPGTNNVGIEVDPGSNVEINYNTIIGSPYVIIGILLTANNVTADPTIADVSHNTISNFLCTEMTSRPAGYCGPNSFTQQQNGGIIVFGIYLPQTTKNRIIITDNYLAKVDNGIGLGDAQNCCTVSGNVIEKSTDYALTGLNGNYTFSNNKIVGSLYAVTAIAGAINTTVTMHDNDIQGVSLAPTYLQSIPPYATKVVFEK
jgi:hypothetical protein